MEKIGKRLSDGLELSWAAWPGGIVILDLVQSSQYRISQSVSKKINLKFLPTPTNHTFIRKISTLRLKSVMLILLLQFFCSWTLLRKKWGLLDLCRPGITPKYLALPADPSHSSLVCLSVCMQALSFAVETGHCCAQRLLILILLLLLPSFVLQL